MEELEKNESNRNKRNENVLKNLEGSTSNFNQLINNFDESSDKTKKRFISAAKHYVERIDTDNLKQDFSKAIEDELSDLKKEVRNVTGQAKQETKEYKEIMKERMVENDKLINQYNKSLKTMIKGITSLFFVIVIIALVVLVTGPIGEFFGVTHLYQFINDFIETHKTIWRYLMLLLYLVPYVLFSLILWSILKLSRAF
ncbi:mobilization protein [Mammaliicoccus vitulinus]|nr:mobilization protein [Mammaliicoccus vitulinus]